jgi:hypothetical protein
VTEYTSDNRITLVIHDERQPNIGLQPTAASEMLTAAAAEAARYAA